MLATEDEDTEIGNIKKCPILPTVMPSAQPQLLSNQALIVVPRQKLGWCLGV